MKEVKLFPRWLMLVFALALATVVAVGMPLYLDQERSLKQEAVRQLMAVADLKVDQIVRWRDTKLRSAQDFTSRSHFMEGVRRWLVSPNAHDEEYTLERLRSLKQYYDFQDVLLVDTEGRVLLSAGGNGGRLHVPALEALSKALRDRVPELTDFHAGSERLGPHIDAVAPIFEGRDNAGAPLGALVFRSAADAFLYPLIQEWPTASGSAETLLVRREGDDVLFLNELRHRKGTALNLRIPTSQSDLPAAMVIQGARGVVEGRDYRGAKVLAAVDAVPDSPWFIVAKEDEAEVYAVWRARSLLIIALLIGATVLIVAVVVVLWQRNAKAHYRSLLDAERTASESERQFREMFEHMQSGGAIYRPEDSGEDFVIVDFNAAAERIEGVERDAVIGKKVTEAFPGVRESGILDLFRRVHETGEPRSLVESYYADARDPGRWRRNSVFKLPSGNVVAVYDDVSERKRWENEREKLIVELERKNAEMERFTYTVSHDLKSPIITIKGFAAELEKTVQEGNMETFRGDLARICAAADRMKSMLDDLLKISRIGRMAGPFVRIDMQELISEVKANLAGLLDKRGIDFVVAAGIPPVDGDRYRIGELFQNLIENSCKFMGDQPRPRVEVGCEERDGERVFFVRDNGIGIDPKYKDNIFELFNKLDAGDEGAGVGLSVVKRIVEVHGGRIWMESEGVGHGAAFFFTLPGKETHHERQ